MTRANRLEIETILEELIADPDQLGAVKRALKDRFKREPTPRKPYLVYDADDDEEDLFDNLPV